MAEKENLESPKKESTTTTTTGGANTNSTRRRIIKAKKPPPPPSSLDLTMDQDDDDDEKVTPRSTPAAILNSPSLNREVEQENSEKWRNERLESRNAVRKSLRDEQLHQRRRHTTNNNNNNNNHAAAAAVSEEGFNNTSATTTTTNNNHRAPVPPALSVEPQFPEHKRRGDAAELDKKNDDDEEEGEPLEKRLRASISVEDDDKKYTDNTSSKFEVGVTALAVAIGVAAIVVAFAMQKRGGRVV